MSDGLIREIALIGRYSRNNEGENRRFRTYVTHSLKLSDGELDAVVRDETDRVLAAIDCTACANCCKTMQPNVDDDDVRRLSARLGVSSLVFRRKYLVVDPADRRSYMSVAPCPFLGNDNRCMVYDDRPKACRDFPYLHAPGFRRRTISMVSNCASCPIVFNVWQALKARLWRRSKGTATPKARRR